MSDISDIELGVARNNSYPVLSVAKLVLAVLVLVLSLCALALHIYNSVRLGHSDGLLLRLCKTLVSDCNE